jgi:hypothetical protein
VTAENPELDAYFDAIWYRRVVLAAETAEWAKNPWRLTTELLNETFDENHVSLPYWDDDD